METIEKIAVESVVVHWVEGEFSAIKNRLYKSLEEINELVKQVAKRELDLGSYGYCKLKFTVKWQDGFQWTGRLDVTGDMAHKANSLEKHIEAEALYLSGVKPPHMSAEEYAQCLLYDNVTEATKESMSFFLKRYELMKSLVNNVK